MNRNAFLILPFGLAVGAIGCTAANVEETDLGTELDAEEVVIVETDDRGDTGSVAARLEGNYVETADYDRAAYPASGDWRDTMKLSFFGAGEYLSANPHEPRERGRVVVVERDAEHFTITFHPTSGSPRTYEATLRAREGLPGLRELTLSSDGSELRYTNVTTIFCAGDAECTSRDIAVPAGADRIACSPGDAVTLGRCVFIRRPARPRQPLPGSMRVFERCGATVDCGRGLICGRQSLCTMECSHHSQCPDGVRAAYLEPMGICRARECFLMPRGE